MFLYSNLILTVLCDQKNVGYKGKDYPPVKTLPIMCNPVAKLGI